MQATMRVLLIDDDPAFLRYSAMALEEAGVEHVAVGDTEGAWRALQASGEFDALLLDVSLPGESGWQFLQSLRKSGCHTPVIFVTCAEAVDQRVRGLKLGADDYIVKPFEFEELIARLEAVVRRHRPTRIEAGELMIDLTRQAVNVRGRRVDLSPREYELLVTIALASGRILSRTELLREVWHLEFEPGTNVLDVHLARLRKKLDDRDHSLIQTVRGEGYRLVTG